MLHFQVIEQNILSFNTWQKTNPDCFWQAMITASVLWNLSRVKRRETLSNPFLIELFTALYLDNWSRIAVLIPKGYLDR